MLFLAAYRAVRTNCLMAQALHQLISAKKPTLGMVSSRRVLPHFHGRFEKGLISSQLTEHLLLEIFGFLVCESILARCQIA